MRGRTLTASKPYMLMAREINAPAPEVDDVFMTPTSPPPTPPREGVESQDPIARPVRRESQDRRRRNPPGNAQAKGRQGLVDSGERSASLRAHRRGAARPGAGPDLSGCKDRGAADRHGGLPPFFCVGSQASTGSSSHGIAHTALRRPHVAAGARIVDFGGWDMPVNYGSQIDEHHAVRRDAGMFDVSHMCVVDLRGDDARAVPAPPAGQRRRAS